jgi:hypothetical protein
MRERERERGREERDGERLASCDRQGQTKITRERGRERDRERESGERGNPIFFSFLDFVHTVFAGVSCFSSPRHPKTLFE